MPSHTKPTEMICPNCSDLGIRWYLDLTVTIKVGAEEGEARLHCPCGYSLSIQGRIKESDEL